MSKIIILIIALFVIISPLKAADWYKIEGQYSYIEYERDLAQTADSLLTIAETWIPRLCNISGAPIILFEEKKVRIILTNAPDIPNGYAVGNDIVIYALSSAYSPNWSGKDSWYETVLKHELVHQLIFRATDRKISVLGLIAALSVPRWFHEGLAQYYAETWNTHRGDLTLQSALIDGKLNFGSLFNLNDGALLYSSSHAFVRFLADQHGDSSFVKLLNYNKDEWIYDFNAAFKSSFGKNVQELFSEFFRYMVIYYGDKLADYPELLSTGKMPQPGFRTLQIIPFADQDSTYLAAIKLDAAHRYATALIFNINKGKVKVVNNLTNNFNTPLVYDSQNHFVAWGRYNIGAKSDQTTLDFRWFIYDLQKDKTIETPQTLRARYASFTPHGNLLLTEVNHNGSVIWNFSIERRELTEIFRTDMPVGNLDVFSDGPIVFDAQDKYGRRNLHLLKEGNVTTLTNDSLINVKPVVINDSLIAFNRTVYNRPTLALYNLNHNNFEIKINAAHTVIPQEFDHKNQKLIVSILDHYQKSSTQTIALDSLLLKNNTAGVVNVQDRFSRWTKVTPNYSTPDLLGSKEIVKSKPQPLFFPQGKLMHAMSFAFPLYTKDLGLGLFGTSTWIESLQRQVLQLNGVLFEKGWNESLLIIAHQLQTFDLSINSLYYHGPAIFAIADGRRLRTYQDIIHINFSQVFPINGNIRSVLIPSLDYSYYRYLIKEEWPDYPHDYNFHGPAISLRYQYYLPTTHYPVLPKRLFSLGIKYFKSLSPAYRFDIMETNMSIGSNLLWEKLGFISKGSYITSSGGLPPLNRVGIDRFYELDIPRDVTYTRTVRGVRQDIHSPNLLWSSNEINFILTDNSDMKLFFIPIEKVVISGFYDYALFDHKSNKQVSSYGFEINGIQSILKFGLGYANGQLLDGARNKEYYWRIGIMLPGFKSKS